MFPNNSQPSSGNKIDVTSLTPFVSSNLLQAFGTAYSNVLSITGKGFLRNATILTASGQVASIRITVDGVVKFEAGSNALVQGVMQFDDIVNSAASTLGFILPTNPGGTTPTFGSVAFPTYPFTAGTAALAVLPIPIYFYKSLLIEMKSAIAGSIGYLISGGYR